MSVAEVDVCARRTIIGTGNCEVPTSDKTNINNSASFSVNVFASEILTDVVENALDVALARANSSNMVGDILVKPEKGSTISNNKDYNASNCEEALPPFGVGDQLAIDEIIPSDVTCKHPLVEKKNRLTDLVRNSKQLLAKLLNDNKQLSDLEEKNEQLVQVIALECVQPGTNPYKVSNNSLPETIPLPPSDDFGDVDDAPDETTMDVIQLCNEMKDASGDDWQKRMTFPIAAGSSKTKGFVAKCRTLRVNTTKIKEKKWNLGSKLLNYIRKHQPKKLATSMEPQACKDNEN